MYKPTHTKPSGAMTTHQTPAMRSKRSHGLQRLVCLCVFSTGAAVDCLADAIPQNQRAPMITDSGSSPLKFWDIGAGFAADVATYVLKIIVEELLGINTEVHVEPHPIPNRHNRTFLALAGCTENLTGPAPENFTQCGSHPNQLHVSIGAHLVEGRMDELNFYHELQASKLGGFIEDLGHLGVMRIGGPQIAQGVFTQAWQEDAISLDFYRTYSANQSFSTPKKFFANISEVTKDELYECSKWEKALWVYVSIRIPNWVEKYVEISGDMDGITQGEQMQLPTCSEGHWWLAPACRSSPETCIPVLIRRRPNAFLEYMQKAAAWRLPWAIAIAKNWNFMSRLGDEPVIWHGQSPTADNLNLKPVFLQFPAFNQELFEQGFRTHEDPGWPYSKLVTRDLERWLPDVREMLQRSWWTVEEAEEFQLKVQQQRRTPEEVACTWLRNQDRWHSWIPRKSSCFYGQGLFDLSTQTFQRNRSNESVCRTCLPGTHSSGIWDVLGSTAECRPCLPGFSQPSVGSRECTQCPPGTFSAGDGAVVCEVCPQGTFQDKFGKSSCVQCATGTTTLIRSAARSEDCECSPGLYLDGDTCRVCPKGLECTGGRTPPKQLAGMYAELHNGSFSVFLCKQHHHCPEGPPGSCVLGRVRRGCSSCKAGTQSSSDGSCVECKPWEVATWLLLLAMIGAGLKAVKWIGTNFRKAALTVAVLGVMFGQVVVCMQSVEAIAQFSLDLTDPAKTLLELLSVFSLDIDRLHLSCFLSSESAVMEYGAQLLIYPVFFVATILLWPLFRRIFRMPSPSVSEYIALHGMLLVALLTSLTLIILQPLQCRGNPNGLATVRARPDVTCWTSEHAVMVAMSIAGVLVFPSATLAAVAFCTWQYPIWLKSPAGLQSFDTWSFLFVRFVPQRFYFGLLLCILNLFTALIPIMMVSAPALQVGMMAVVLWLRQDLLCQMYGPGAGRVLGGL